MLLFEDLNIRVYMVDICHTADLYNALDSLHQQGLFDKTFYEERVQELKNISNDFLPNARSIIILSRKDPAFRFLFTYSGKKVELLVPPTYLYVQRKIQEIYQFLSDLPELKGYALVRAALPRKRLAVCSGLAEYGKNNITYVKGFGSYHHLGSFYSEMECPHDEWHEPVMMECCRTCKACTLACPTGAIGTDRFLLHGERCMTYFDEKPAEVPFPDWVQRDWHNSLVGCMRCQMICPENKPTKDWIKDGEEFSEEETTWLLSGKLPEEIPQRLKEKLIRCDLLDMLDVFPRNLGAFFA